MLKTYAVLTCLAVALLAGPADAETLLEMDRFQPEELRMVGLELARGGSVRVDAVGVRPRHSHHLAAYAWILNSSTRELVWSMDEERTSRHQDDRLLRRVEATVDLPAGSYEIYYWAGTRAWRGDGDWHDFGNVGRWFRDNWKRDDRWSGHRDLERALDDCKLTISSDQIGRGDIREFEPTGGFANALVRHNQLGDSEHIETGFELSRDTELQIYGVIEFPDDWRHPADHSWILDAKTRELVWEMEWSNSKPAGGADKNRVVDDVVKLPKGKYILVTGTDDSHSWEEFNAAPPADPLNWGITILAASSQGAKSFKTTQVPERGEPVIDMTRLRDYEFQEQAFRLKKKGKLQILALGEYSYGDREFADYGWIQRAGTDDIVWEMTRRNTRHAGGAAKNRLFEGSVDLESGEYVALFVTDDSHSYRRWNSDAPYDRRAWGIAIWPGDGLQAKDIEKLAVKTVERTANVLVQITRVGDDERLRERFSLDAPTQLHIFSLGEGVDGRMYDYGYIVNEDSDDVVWEMSYRKSRHAGGARKNRFISQEITLDPGTYTVYYETDGSHSFPDWNARRPRDPQKWGITVSLSQ